MINPANFSPETDARASNRTETALAGFLTRFSIEALPGEVRKAGVFGELLPQGTDVYLTSIAGSPFNDQIEAARIVRDRGFNPVPHIAARDIKDKADLTEHLDQLTSTAGVDSALVIAGEREWISGEFSDSLQLLRTGSFEKAGLKRISIAGYPEGSPKIPEATLRKALHEKASFAKQSPIEFCIVTQFCFNARQILSWVESVRADGIELPIDIGIPGAATVATLLRYAKLCGVGASMKALRSQGLNLAKFTAVSSPEDIVAPIANYREMHPDSGIRRPHLFPFGALKRTVEWVNNTSHRSSAPGRDA